jgi:hypothetical protein
MTVFQLLAAQHRWGPYRTATALEFAEGRSRKELKELISHGFPGF